MKIKRSKPDQRSDRHRTVNLLCKTTQLFTFMKVMSSTNTAHTVFRANVFTYHIWPVSLLLLYYKIVYNSNKKAILNILFWKHSLCIQWIHHELTLGKLLFLWKTIYDNDLSKKIITSENDENQSFHLVCQNIIIWLITERVLHVN